MLKAYNIAIHVYGVFLRISAIFNQKARKLVAGRSAIFANLEGVISPDEHYVWFHCASLGEFEQGRTVLERVREHYPNLKILLTFYSPSGFEVRKNYSKADIVTFLPLDTADNAARFLDLVKPQLAVFVKYEFWPNFLFAMRKRNIPLVSVSAIFRQNQVYFWDFGQFFKDILRNVSLFFVQDVASVQLLNNIGITNIKQVGDTRFDRVKELSMQAVNFEEIVQFINDKKCFIAGSTYAADEEFLLEYFLKTEDWKLIIVPHEIQPAHLSSLMDKCGEHGVLQSTSEEDISHKKVLIIDTIGKLSKIYKYADIAYVGGGFGKGIHNVLEPAVWTKPIIIGPHYQKYKEAKGLVDIKAAYPMMNKAEFPSLMKKFASDEKRKSVGERAKNYVEENTGATEIILEELKNYLEKL